MTPKKVLPPATPPNDTENPVSELAARPKRSPTVVKKPAAKAPKAARAKPPKPVGKSLGKKATPEATPAAAKTSSPPPAQSSPRSSARPATQTKPRKPARVKTTDLLHTPDQAPNTASLKTALLLPELAVGTTAPETSHPGINAAETPAPANVTPPVVNDADLWEKESPIRLRIAQLRTRNALLEEQLQRLRPPLQVRGKKK
jgi:hypothetical protein